MSRLHRLPTVVEEEEGDEDGGSVAQRAASPGSHSSTSVAELRARLAAAQDLLFVTQAERDAAESALRADLDTAQAATQATRLQLQAAEQRGEALEMQVGALTESLSLSEAGRESAQRRAEDVARQLGEGIKARFVDQLMRRMVFALRKQQRLTLGTSFRKWIVFAAKAETAALRQQVGKLQEQNGELHDDLARAKLRVRTSTAAVDAAESTVGELNSALRTARQSLKVARQDVERLKREAAEGGLTGDVVSVAVVEAKDTVIVSLQGQLAGLRLAHGRAVKEATRWREVADHRGKQVAQLHAAFTMTARGENGGRTGQSDEGEGEVSRATTVLMEHGRALVAAQRQSEDSRLVLTRAARREEELTREIASLGQVSQASQAALQELEESVARSMATLQATKRHEDMLKAQLEVRHHALQASQLRITTLEDEVEAKRRELRRVHEAVDEAMRQASIAEGRHAKTRAELELLKESTQGDVEVQRQRVRELTAVVEELRGVVEGTLSTAEEEMAARLSADLATLASAEAVDGVRSEALAAIEAMKEARRQEREVAQGVGQELETVTAQLAREREAVDALHKQLEARRRSEEVDATSSKTGVAVTAAMSSARHMEIVMAQTLAEAEGAHSAVMARHQAAVNKRMEMMVARMTALHSRVAAFGEWESNLLSVRDEVRAASERMDDVQQQLDVLFQRGHVGRGARDEAPAVSIDTSSPPRPVQEQPSPMPMTPAAAHSSHALSAAHGAATPATYDPAGALAALEAMRSASPAGAPASSGSEQVRQQTGDAAVEREHGQSGSVTGGVSSTTEEWSLLTMTTRGGWPAELHRQYRITLPPPVLPASRYAPSPRGQATSSSRRPRAPRVVMLQGTVAPVSPLAGDGVLVTGMPEADDSSNNSSAGSDAGSLTADTAKRRQRRSGLSHCALLASHNTPMVRDAIDAVFQGTRCLPGGSASGLNTATLSTLAKHVTAVGTGETMVASDDIRAVCQLLVSICLPAKFGRVLRNVVARAVSLSGSITLPQWRRAAQQVLKPFSSPQSTSTNKDDLRALMLAGASGAGAGAGATGTNGAAADAGSLRRPKGGARALLQQAARTGRGFARSPSSSPSGGMRFGPRSRQRSPRR